MFRNNCLRDNRWGLANQRHRLTDALITGNRSYEIGTRPGEIGRTYEIGWALKWTERVTISDNTAVRDLEIVSVENAKSILIENNTVQDVQLRGVLALGGTESLRIVSNKISGGIASGIIFGPSLASGTIQSTKGAEVTGNGITVAAFGIGLGNGAAVTETWIHGNAWTFSGGTNSAEGIYLSTWAALAGTPTTPRRECPERGTPTIRSRQTQPMGQYLGLLAGAQ